jgi:GMP synthase-like glutamine amidotransferase
MQPRIHLIQHSDGSGPGSTYEWLTSKKLEATLVRMHKGDRLPAVEDTDWIIVFGGPMNVDEVEAHPFLIEEKAFLKKALDAKKTLLGVCLGGQLLAQTLGAKVTKAPEWEVGWHVVHLGQNQDAEQRLVVFQWHQDTFGLPPGAHRVASNTICENQAYFFGDRVVGVQFHPEATEEWVIECAADTDYPSGKSVQTPVQLVEGMMYQRPLKKWYFDLLNRMEIIASQKT